MHLLLLTPPVGLTHLPTQFAALSSHCIAAASAGEWSTPVPMRVIANKRCRVMVEPPEPWSSCGSDLCVLREPRVHQADNRTMASTATTLRMTVAIPATSMLEIRLDAMRHRWRQFERRL